MKSRTPSSRSLLSRFTETSDDEKERRGMKDKSAKVKRLNYMLPSCFRSLDLGKSKDHNESAAGYTTKRRSFTIEVLSYGSSGEYPLYSQIELSLFSEIEGHLIAVLFMVDKDGNLDEFGRTEVTLAPNWIEKITVPFQSEALQPLVFRLFNVSDMYRNIPVTALTLVKLTYLGEATCFLSEIMTKPGQSVTLQLVDDFTNVGTLRVQAEETVASKTVVKMTLGSEDLDPKSEYFLRISRLIRDNTTIAVPVSVTKVVKNSPNPIWEPICLTLQHFERKETPLLLECDYKTSERIG